MFVIHVLILQAFPRYAAYVLGDETTSLFSSRFLHFLQVFEYDPYTRNCCNSESVKPFTQRYPLHPKDNVTRIIDGKTVPPLTGNVDAVYFSYNRYRMFFVKNHFVWENHVISVWNADGTFNKLNPIDVNELIFRGRVEDVWYDICEVAPNDPQQNCVWPSSNG